MDSIRRTIPNKQNLEFDVEIVKVTEEQFISGYIIKLENNNQGTFTRQKNKNTRGYKQFLCERSGKPTGKSTGDPSQTRCNTCPAYVSFRFVTENGQKAVIIRKNLLHTGHIIGEKSQEGKNHIHGELVSFIRNLTVLNKKANEIIVEVADWSSSRGHNDPGDGSIQHLKTSSTS